MSGVQDPQYLEFLREYNKIFNREQAIARLMKIYVNEAELIISIT